MTAALPAGAASHREADWHSIDWQQANHNVRRLQARIVKATQEGRWGKVNALQRLLTHSFSGKALAVRRVTENTGKRTPGVDGIVWDSPAKKAAAVQTLRQHGYRPQPLRRIYIPKRNGKKRPLGIPTMKDRAMQALYLLAVDPIAETTADRNSYGFRKERSPADAMEACHQLLSRRDSPAWILEGDIKACFDRIDHEWLLAHAPVEQAMLRKWLKAGFMEKHVLMPTNEGTPQGGILSPVLANLTLDGLEALLAHHFPPTKSYTKGRSNPKVHLVRFADDFIITGASRALLEHAVKPLVEQFMREQGLELSPEKTVITHIEHGFDFLGQHVRKYRNGKRLVTLITPSKKSVTALLDKVRGIVKARASISAGKLIEILTPVIRGWVYYHRTVASKHTFNDVDHALFKILWRWARRRHHAKSSTWIKEKYFKCHGSYSWVFSGEVATGKGRTLPRRLFLASTVPIRRHTRIKGAANPYDPDWELYIEERHNAKMRQTLYGRGMLLYLWNEQNGRCALCHQPITKATSWHNHHIVWRSKGGSDHATNRVLLHPNCHRQVHSRNITVVKPRPVTRALPEA